MTNEHSCSDSDHDEQRRATQRRQQLIVDTIEARRNDFPIETIVALNDDFRRFAQVELVAATWDDLDRAREAIGIHTSLLHTLRDHAIDEADRLWQRANDDTDDPDEF